MQTSGVFVPCEKHLNALINVSICKLLHSFFEIVELDLDLFDENLSMRNFFSNFLQPFR